MNKPAMIDGKTISSIQENAPNPHTGRPGQSIMLLHFTDGTALGINGGGDDCDDWISHELLTSEQVHKRAQLAQKHKDDLAEQTRKREAWMALTCEQRAQRQPKPSTDNLLLDEQWRRYALEDLARSVGSTQVNLPCTKCGETQCSNAPTRQLKPTVRLTLTHYNAHPA